ncbi:MAG: hypothetical protein AMS18_02895 [Gemmatimonas sp. SG8_17]|nr:MAG: hypothetical protein AMS18_02895 [Gemmatimonas sp. SG8_17]
MKFSTRLIIGTLVVVIITITTFVVATNRSLRQNLDQLFIQELERQARLVAAAIATQPLDLNVEAHRLGILVERRVTFIDLDGAVVGDSDFDDQNLLLLENHIERPEVQAALAGQVGVHQRVSTSTNRAELKVAIPAWPGIVRISAPLDQRNEVIRAMVLRTLLAGLVAALVGTLLAVLGARILARPLANLALAARSVASGGSPLYPVTSTLEIQELVRAFQSMHDELSKQITELHRERGETQTIIESMAEGVIAADERGRIVMCNDATRQILGLGPNDSLTDLRKLLHQSDALQTVEEVLAGTPVLGRELQLGPRDILATARPLPNRGAVLGLLDVTDLKRLQTMRRDFVGNVSHELKTPLTSIMGYAETLLSESPDAEVQHQFLAKIRDNAQRMQALVDDLLDLTRLESGAWQPAIATVDVASVGREVWAAVAADARQILTNLVDNALRHTPAGGIVSLLTRDIPEAAVWEIEVHDNGAGIPPQHVPRVFERFYRVDAGRARAAGGTGLGLAIVKHLVEGHGGSVSLESTVGQGTKVQIRIPYRPQRILNLL